MVAQTTRPGMVTFTGYSVHEQLDEGGFATVSLASSDADGNNVAIKHFQCEHYAGYDGVDSPEGLVRRGSPRGAAAHGIR